MKKLEPIILFMILFSGIYCGCGDINTITVQDPEDGIYKRVCGGNVSIIATGEYSVTAYKEYDTRNGNVTITYFGESTEDTTDYVSVLSIAVWNGSAWENLSVDIGHDYISGEHKFHYMNIYEKVRLTALLFTEEQTNDTAFIRISNIYVN